VGHLDLAYDYFGEAALIDLDDLEHNTRDGLHIASLAGAWIAAVAGFGGFRNHGGRLTFKPRLPPQLTRLAFGLTYRERRLRVLVEQSKATYSLAAGDSLELRHYDETITLRSEGSAARSIPPMRPRPAPQQPRGRAPARRSRQH
jgi:alpha,alpha-trehalose phosphorylase